MGFLGYVRAVRKYWWIVVLTLVAALGLGAVVTLNTTRLYSTALTFFVKTPSDQLSTAAQGDTFGQKRVNSYVQLATTDRILKPVLMVTKLQMTPAELAREIVATGDINTVLLTVTVTDKDPQRSLLIAEAVSTQFVKVVADLESASAADGSTVALELVSGPNLNPTPVEPRPAINYGLAGLIGLLIGLALAILREFLDTTIRTAQALEKATGAAIIGVIAWDEKAKSHPLIVDGDAQSIRAEAFRQLRTNLEFVDVDSPAKVVVITSSIANEGKSTTATNLAVIFAEAGKKVLLIEGDLRRPRVADYLGIEGTVGLTNVLAGQVDVTEVLQPWGRGGLTVLPSGSIPPNPSELLGSRNMRTLIESMTASFDLILIDTPPILPVTDAAVMAVMADGALLVVHHGTTTRQQVAHAASALRKVDARLLGCVLNMAPAKGADSYSYGYGYGYGATYSDQSNEIRELLTGKAADLARDSVLSKLETKKIPPLDISRTSW